MKLSSFVRKCWPYFKVAPNEIGVTFENWPRKLSSWIILHGTHYKCSLRLLGEETTFPLETFLFPAAALDVSLVVGLLYLSSFLGAKKPCQLHNERDSSLVISIFVYGWKIEDCESGGIIHGLEREQHQRQHIINLMNTLLCIFSAFLLLLLFSICLIDVFLATTMLAGRTKQLILKMTLLQLLDHKLHTFLWRKSYEFFKKVKLLQECVSH